MRVATIDIGTNTILLLIADFPGDVVTERMRIVRLGQGVDASGALAPEAIERGLDTLREYAAVMRQEVPARVGVIGTQTLREVANGEAFLGPAQEILGVPVQVIDGPREAELAYGAVQRSFPELGDVLVCDVGGGSTELIVARGGKIDSLKSVKIGSVRLTERFLKSDPPAREEAAAMIAAIDEALGELPRGLPLVATAGTATTLAAIALALPAYDATRVHGLRLPRAEVERQLARLLEAPLAEKLRFAGLDAKRADVIAGGAAVIARVMSLVGSDEVVISDRGIRWGLAYELAAAP